MISIVSGLCMIMGLDVHSQLSRWNYGVAAAAKNIVEDDNNNNNQDESDNDDDDDCVHVIDVSDVELFSNNDNCKRFVILLGLNIVALAEVRAVWIICIKFKFGVFGLIIVSWVVKSSEISKCW